jgi:hypothetical protein
MKKISYIAVVKEYSMRRAFDLLLISVAMVVSEIVAGTALQSQARPGDGQALIPSASIHIPMRNLPANSDIGLPGSSITNLTGRHT